MVFSFLFGKKQNKRFEISSDVVDNVLFPFMSSEDICHFSTGINHKLTEFHFKWLLKRDFDIVEEKDSETRFKIERIVRSQISVIEMVTRIIMLNLKRPKLFPTNSFGVDLKETLKTRDERYTMVRRTVALLKNSDEKTVKAIVESCDYWYAYRMIKAVSDNVYRMIKAVSDNLYCEELKFEKSRDKVEIYLGSKMFSIGSH